MMHGLAEIQPTELDPHRIILKIQTDNPHVRDEKGLTYAHIAAKYCMPDVALWMFYVGPPLPVAHVDEITAAQFAENHGHSFVAHLLAPESGSIYEHAILLWMLKKKYAQFDQTLRKLLTTILGENVRENVIKNIRNKKNDVPAALENMLSDNDLYIQAFEEYYNAFTQSIKKSSIIAINSLCALLFLVSDSLNDFSIAELLLQKKKFNMLKIWIITNNIHPYDVICKVKNESVIQEFISVFWSKQGILAYTINKMLLEPDDLRHREFFIYLPKSDKTVFNVLLRCLADKNVNPGHALIIDELLKNPDDSISDRAAKLQNVSPDTANYFNDFFSKFNLVVRIGQPRRQQALPAEAIMQIMGVRKKVQTDIDEADEKDEYESQPSIPSMLTHRGINRLARANSNLFHLTHLTPKRPTQIQSKLAQVNTKLQENKSRLQEVLALSENIKTLVEQLEQEQEDKSYCQHRSWSSAALCTLTESIVGACAGFSAYSTKSSSDKQADAVHHLKEIIITIGNRTLSCYEFFYSSGFCRGSYMTTPCKDSCVANAHYSEMEGGYLVGAVMLGICFFTICAACVAGVYDEFKLGPERLDEIAISNYSAVVQNKVRETLDTLDLQNMNISAERVKVESARILLQLSREQQTLEGRIKYLTALHSLLSKRYQFFSPPPVDMGVGLGLQQEEGVRDLEASSRLTQMISAATSRFPHELTIPLLDETQRERAPARAKRSKCMIQ